MKQKLLAAAIVAALFAPATMAWAQDLDQTEATTAQPDAKKKEQVKQLDKVTVTGSLIPMSQVETVNPVITISGKDIETQGFRNVYDALRSLPQANGSVQDNQFTNGFTPGANTISLFGLDPGFTLVLLNGHPLADYPLPYNGSQNFVDLATIPTAMVDHIDILPGSASSIYGSSAVAGVVNVVLKSRVEGTTLNYRAGGYWEGGGQNQRIAITSGHNFGKLDVVGSLQYMHQDPIWTFQRKWADSLLDNPNISPTTPAVADRAFLVLTGGRYLDPNVTPGVGGCSQIGNLFGGSIQRDYRRPSGYFCGTYNDVAYRTLLNESDTASGYLNARYHLSDNTEAYAEILYTWSRPKYNSGTQFWQSNYNGGGYFYNANTRRFELWQRILAPEELGGLDVNSVAIRTRAFNITTGLRGTFGQSTWDYDFFYNRSQTNTDANRRWPLSAPFDQFYLGTPLGTRFGYPIYAPSYTTLYTPLTPAQYQSLTGSISSQSVSWLQNLNAVVTNNNLFDLPAGPVGIAGIVQAGNQAFNNPVDPGVIAGNFLGITGTQGSGTRKNYAVGGELRAPITSMLTADVSARWDDYRFAGRSDAKTTYKAGLEFRPLQTLMFRGNYATSFRAPDMFYIFQGPSGFFQGSNTDYYQCRLDYPTVPIAGCPLAGNQTLFAQNQGNPNLKDVTAKSWGLGMVWSPTERMNIKIDYQNIRIDNEISTLSIDGLLQAESNCRFGSTPGGQTIDPNSPTCLDALSRVVRFPATDPVDPNGIDLVKVSPINISNEKLDGISAEGSYRFDLGRWGDLGVNANYFVMLNHEYQQYPSDPALDLLHNYNSYEFKTRFGGALTWNIGDWSSTIYGQRLGNSVNRAGTGTLPPYVTFNGSVRYNLSPDAYVSLIVNNIANKRPPVDKSAVFPYFNIFNFNGYQRAFWVEFNYRFGASGS